MSNNINIENEDDNLKGMAPHLSKMKTHNPFKPDEDYFESFTNKLQKEITDFEEIKNEAPVLTSIPKYGPFEIPVDYFSEFPGRIQLEVIKTKSQTTILEWLILFIKPRFAVPVLCTMLIAFAGIRFMNNNATTLPEKDIVQEINTEEQLYNIDEVTLMESMNTTENAEIRNASTEDANIQNYLIENNIDENNI